MKKAEIILTCIAIFAIIGGIVAFKASRFPPNVYTQSGTTVLTIIVGGVPCSATIPNCTLTEKCTTNVGPFTIVNSRTTSQNAVAVFICTNGMSITTTYPFCTTWLTRTTVPDE